MSRAEAPSLSGEALPAVMVPSGRNDGLQARQRLGCRLRSDALVSREVHPVDGDDEVVVEAGLPGGVGELVRAGRELVLPLAGDREAARRAARWHSPSDTVHSAGIRGLTSRQPSVVETAARLPAG